MSKEKLNIQYGVLGILGVIFLTLLVASTSNSSLTSEFLIKDKLELNVIPDYNSPVEVATLKITNNALLPKKQNLDEYVLCNFDKDFGTQTINLEFVGKVTSEYNDIFSSRYEKSVEVSSGETQELGLIIDYLPFRYDERSGKELELEDTTLYLIKVNQDEYSWNYCSKTNKDESIKTIEVIFNLEEDTK